MQIINTNKLSATQRIERVTALIMADKELMQFGPLILFAGVRAGQCNTAHTDGRTIVVGEEFIKQLDDAGLAFVVLHEALHIAYRHLYIYRNLVSIDSMTANKAMDYVINLQLFELSRKTKTLHMPVDSNGDPMGLLDHKYAGLDTNQVFDLIRKENKNTPQQGQQQPGQQGQQQPGQQGQQQPGQQGQQGQPQQSSHGGFDEHDWAKAGAASEKDVADIKREVEQALRHGANLASKAKGSVSRDLRRILESEFDWGAAVDDFIRAAFSKGYSRTTFRRLNRRLQAAGVYMGSTYDDAFRRMVIGIDTSGSINAALISKFIGHVVKVISDLNPEELILMYWDSEVCQVERYGGDVSYAQMLETTKPAGGGGTDPSCIPDYLRTHNIENVECVLVLTDGFFSTHGDWDGFPDPLWCVLKEYHDRFTAIVGNSIPID